MICQSEGHARNVLARVLWSLSPPLPPWDPVEAPIFVLCTVHSQLSVIHQAIVVSSKPVGTLVTLLVKWSVVTGRHAVWPLVTVVRSTLNTPHPTSSCAGASVLVAWLCRGLQSGLWSNKEGGGSPAGLWRGARAEVGRRFGREPDHRLQIQAVSDGRWTSSGMCAEQGVREMAPGRLVQDSRPSGRRDGDRRHGWAVIEGEPNRRSKRALERETPLRSNTAREKLGCTTRSACESSWSVSISISVLHAG